MTEHEASAVAEEAPATTGTEAETPAAPAPKRRSRKSAAESEADHPSLFAINLDDPELPCAPVPFELRVEATILLADRPISDARIAEVLGLVPPAVRASGKDGETPEADAETSARDSAAIAGRRREALRLVREAVDALNQQYAASNRTFRIESVSGGRQMLTIAAFGRFSASRK